MIMYRPILLLLSVLVLSSQTTAQFTTATCGVSKACFQSPANCNASDSSCLFVSWTYNSTTTDTMFEVSGPASSGDYVAVGLTLIAGMEQADTYICTESEMVSSVITTAVEPIDEENFPEGVSLIGTSQFDGKIQCSFIRPLSVTKSVSGVDTVFDFSTGLYFILIAAGPADNVGTSIADDHVTKARSADRFDLTVGFEGGGGAGVSSLIKWHGSLMIVAWLLLAQVGVLIAKYYKPSWPGKKVAGKDVWFQVHRGVMGTAVLATVVGFILIFIDAGGFIETSNNGSALAHVIIGFIVTALALANPIIAYFRPHPGTPKRIYFFVSHAVIGWSARSLGLANMIIGVGLPAIGLAQWTMWVLVGFTVAVILLEIVAALLTYRTVNSKPGPENIDMGNSPNVSTIGKDSEKYGEAKHATLVIFVLIALGCSIALWVAIAQA